MGASCLALPLVGVVRWQRGQNRPIYLAGTNGADAVRSGGTARAQLVAAGATCTCKL